MVYRVGYRLRRVGKEALEAGQAPRVVLRATHETALDHCLLADLKRFPVDLA
jgi:uncharacterized protein (DUF2237 family)